MTHFQVVRRSVFPLFFFFFLREYLGKRKSIVFLIICFTKSLLLMQHWGGGWGSERYNLCTTHSAFRCRSRCADEAGRSMSHHVAVATRCRGEDVSERLGLKVGPLGLKPHTVCGGAEIWGRGLGVCAGPHDKNILAGVSCQRLLLF